MHGAMLSGIEQAEKILEFKDLLDECSTEEVTTDDHEDEDHINKTDVTEEKV